MCVFFLLVHFASLLLPSSPTHTLLVRLPLVPLNVVRTAIVIVLFAILILLWESIDGAIETYVIEDAMANGGISLS